MGGGAEVPGACCGRPLGGRCACGPGAVMPLGGGAVCDTCAAREPHIDAAINAIAGTRVCFFMISLLLVGVSVLGIADASES